MLGSLLGSPIDGNYHVCTDLALPAQRWAINKDHNETLAQNLYCNP